MNTLEWIIILAVIILILAYLVSKRNRFQALKNEVDAQKSNISNYIEQRTKYLNDALNVAKISYSHEVEGMEKLTANEKFEQLRALGERYPQLQNTASYQETISRLPMLERDIAASKTLLNGNIREYNEAISMFPALIVAKIFGYKRETFIDEENMESNKVTDRSEVDFSKF